MHRNRNGVCAVLATVFGLLWGAPAQAAWQTNYAFGATLKGDLYTPTKLGTPPAILVAIHYCGGNAGAAHSWFQSAADTNGFYIITPDAGKNCFDSSASRDGDKAAIVKMVDTVVALGGDKSRVFAAGFSSGGCMTNTLIAVYPDVFAGGSALPGYPAGAWPKGDTSCQLCGGAGPGGSDTGSKYADLVKGVFAFSGTRPCSQQWVGAADQYHFADWLPVVVSEFQTLGNLGSGSSGAGAPSGWTRTVYKDTSGNVRLETNTKPGQNHDLTGSGLAGSVISFLGLDESTGACGITGGGTGGASGSGGGSGSGGVSGSGGGGGNRDAGVDGAGTAKEVGHDVLGDEVLGPGGALGSGGAEGSGGVISNGGASGKADASSTGGALSSGGGSGSGRTSSSGGTAASGGATANGGTSSKGGSAGSASTGFASSGGTSGNGGSSGGGGSTNAGDGGSSGCNCAVAAGSGHGSRTLTMVMLALLGLTLNRRRRLR